MKLKTSYYFTFLIPFLCFTGCGKVYHVTQQQTSYNQYKASKYKKLINKTKYPKRKKVKH